MVRGRTIAIFVAGAVNYGCSYFMLLGAISDSCFFFFFNDTATTEIYTLSLHDALPISTEGVYCSRCVYYGKHQSFQATAGFRDYAPNAYSSSNGWSVFYQ